MLPLLLAAAASIGAGRPTTTAVAVPSGTTVSVDGIGEEPFWAKARPAGDFVQHEPDEDRAPTEHTRVRAAYDEHAIYFLVEAADSEAPSIQGQLTRRDVESASDWIHIWVDTFEDARTAYRFSVNAAGVKGDARVFDEGKEDPSWDAVWEVHTRTATGGWSAEFRVPLSQLRYDKERPRWGFQVRRDLRRKNEKSYLAATPKGSDRPVAYFGVLQGLETLPTSWPLSLTPYARGALVQEDGERTLAGTAGVDAKLGLGSSLNLELTVNPDFGQVEADPSVLNLSGLETYFQEKRSFFLEGRDLFNFPTSFGDDQSQSLFYSRRIGRAPSLEPDYDEDAGERLVSAGEQATILGAAKLTGKTAGGWSVGLLEAVTDRARATINGPAGERVQTLEPRSNALVLRLGRDLRGGETSVGLLATHLYSILDDESRGSFLEHALAVGGDVQHRVGELLFIGRLYGSYVTGDAEALSEVQRSSVHYFQRPDATHFALDEAATSLSGYGLSATFGKLGGKHWRGAVGVQAQSPGLEINALGYLPSVDNQLAFVWGQLRDDEPNGLYQRCAINANAWVVRTYGEETTALGGNVNGSAVLASYWSVYAGAGREQEALDPIALRGGPALLQPGLWQFWAGLHSDERETWVLDLNANANLRDDAAGQGYWLQAAGIFRPTTALELSVSPFVERRVRDLQYLDTLEDAEGTRHLVARLLQTTVGLQARLNWTFNPELSLQVYASPFLSAGTYRDPKLVRYPRAVHYRDRFLPASYDGSDRFLFAELRSNVVLRYEYLLGSAAFLVWSHGQTFEREDVGELALGRDLGDLLAAASEDVVMLKLSYWLSL